MFQLDLDGDGLVDFADFQRGIAFMQRAFGLDSGVSSNHASPKLDPRLTPHHPVRHVTIAEEPALSPTAASAAAAAMGMPPKHLSQSKLLRDVARKAGGGGKEKKKSVKKSSSTTAVTPPKAASRKKKRASSGAPSPLPHRLGKLDEDMRSAEATEQSTNNEPDESSSSASDTERSTSDEPLAMLASEAMVVRRKSSAAVFVQQLTPEQFGEIEKLFLKYDDGSGRISLTSLELIVRRVDPGLPDAEVRKMIKSVDTGSSTGVGFQDFLRSMHALFKALRLKRALHRPQQTQTTQALRETLRKRATLQRENGQRLSTADLEIANARPTAPTIAAAAPATSPMTTAAAAGPSTTAASSTSKPTPVPQLRNSPSSLSLLDSHETSEEVASVDEALWRHVEMLEEELHAARQEIVLLSKLAKARQRESRVLGDPAEMASWLVLQAQRDGEAGERASAAIANAIGADERLYRRVARVADQRRRREQDQ